ncbi:DUF2325 domain-containing protein [Hathewaya histolytica]|uniref:Uncharacterized protein conserved in bacteria (DUF2325) n=1 Tax=Hathewaya histolytica TaxID=1498 RepID=A0A4U9RER1_HATHI|nr:DUF2325 domain-containing protein [Hathewaya histolytica]VTQ88853.1 Uncharacterized protein conserved in bacteria (DUF2325) [Hathewaya histolytica]
MQLNIIPLLVQALSTNKRIYKDIDKIYNRDKLRFIKSAKEDEFYTHPMAQEGDVEQEYYFKKALGIVNVSKEDQEIGEELFKILKKGWRYTFTYVENHSKIIMSEFLDRFIKKNKGIDNIQDDYLNSNCTIVIFLAYNLDKNIIKEDIYYHKCIETLVLRLEHYKTENRINLNNVTKEQKQLIRNLELRLKNNTNINPSIPCSYRALTDQHDGLNLNLNKLSKEDKFFLPFEYIYDFEKMSLTSIVGEDLLKSKETQELIYAYSQFQKKDEFNYDEFLKYIYPAIQIRYLCKQYKKSKEFFFKNFNEELYEEINKKDIENKEVKKSNLLLQDENERFKLRIEELERENKKLKNELKNREDYKSEIVPLREFIFNMDNREGYKEEDINYNKIEGLNAIIIGGHQQWQTKMKEYLKNSNFISVENLNFDTDILLTADIVFIYTNYLNHAMYYKVIDIARENNLKVVYLKSNTNPKIVLKQIQKSVE